MLRPVLKEAAKFIEGYVVPEFPKLPKTKKIMKKLSREQQEKVLDCLKIHREAIELSIVYPIRPCEVRALQWSDIDFENNRITVRRHYSGKQILPGRKSFNSGDDPYFELPFHMSPEIRKMLLGMKNISIGLGKDSAVFQTRNGNQNDESLCV